MGVYIKGMEMPVTCCQCPLMGYDPEIEWNDGGREAKGAYICVMTLKLIDNTKREDHCPLVPVPPHGRLIDADRLGFAMMDAANVDQALAMVDDAPTIIPAKEAGQDARDDP